MPEITHKDDYNAVEKKVGASSSVAETLISIMTSQPNWSGGPDVAGIPLPRGPAAIPASPGRPGGGVSKLTPLLSWLTRAWRVAPGASRHRTRLLRAAHTFTHTAPSTPSPYTVLDRTQNVHAWSSGCERLTLLHYLSKKLPETLSQI